MRTTRALPLAAGAAAVLLLGGCGAYLGDPGPRQSEEREVADGVHRLVLETSGTVVLEQGDTPSLTITAGRDVLPGLTSDVVDGALVLDDDRRGWGHRGPVEYRLVLPRLEGVTVAGSGDVHVDVADADALAVEVSGSGSVEVDEVDAREVSVAISGSGDVLLAGTAERQDVVIAGSGGYAADGLATAEASVAVQGSGDALVDVSDALDAVVTGSGSVLHTGGARVSETVAGSGDVAAG